MHPINVPSLLFLLLFMPNIHICVKFHFVQVAAFREKIQSCREMLDKIPGVDTNVEKQKRELEFYQNKYKEKW